MTDTGGAAFPQIAELGDIGYRTSGGMTLRDWFAGQALAGYFGYTHAGHQNAACKDTAEYLYAMADAMLAARTSGTGVG